MNVNVNPGVRAHVGAIALESHYEALVCNFDVPQWAAANVKRLQGPA